MSEADPEPHTVALRVGHHTLRCSVAGTHGVPLLLVNGMGASLELWKPFRDALGDARSVAYDAPGTGGSSTPWRPVSMRELARTALGVADELGAPTIDVLGYSFGGAVAQEMARLAPRRVRRLVLAATNCGWGAPIGDPFSLAGATTAPVRFVHPPDPIGHMWQIVAISTWTSLPWLHRVRQPSLVLSAGEDRVVPEAAARMLARALPHACVEVIPGAGHWFLADGHAAEAAARVAAFLGAVQEEVGASVEAPDDAPDDVPDDVLACT
jgi:pimeloyl-ACP methyl ester carboxylesterase